MPVFFLEGLAGSFFRPLALAYVLAVVASLVVALTVTPALSLLLLAGRPNCRARHAALARAQAAYRRAAGILDRPRAAMALLAALFAARRSPPAPRRGVPARVQGADFLMHWVEKPGTSLEAMQRITVRASRELRAIPGVRNFGSHIGRAEVADEVVGPNFTELWISVDPRCRTSRRSKIQQVVDGYPGLYRDVLTYLKERIKEVLTGGSAAIVVRVYGPDMDVLLREGAGARQGDRRGRGRGRPPGGAAGAGAPDAGRLRPEAARFGLTPATSAARRRRW